MNKKYIQFCVDSDTYKRLKIKLIEKDQTLQQVCEDAVKKLITESTDQFGVPNEVNEEVLLEMANAIQKYTGLPGVIYFSTRDEVKNKQAHALGRIKWLHAGKEASMTIKPNKDGKRIASGDQKLFGKLEKFIVSNEDLLWEYWNTPTSEADSAATMQKFKKV